MADDATYIKKETLARALQNIWNSLNDSYNLENDHIKSTVLFTLRGFVDDLAVNLDLDIRRTCLRCQQPLRNGRCQNLVCENRW